MWPFADVSLETATLWGEAANITLLICLLGGVLATFVIVRTSNVKEHHWDSLRVAAKQDFDLYKIDSAKEVAAVRADADLKIDAAREEAKVELGKAQVEIAQAKKQTAALEKEAADARLEQERLRAQLAWRRLGALETRAFVQNITGKIEKIILFNLSPDPETASYVVDLNSAFTRAGVTVDARSGIGGSPYSGIGLEGGSEQERAAVIEAFAAAGVIVRSEAPFGALTLIVGGKPPPP